MVGADDELSRIPERRPPPAAGVGANLARLELRVLFEELLRRLPGFRPVAGHEPEFAPGYFTRTLKEFWVEFSPPH